MELAVRSAHAEMTTRIFSKGELTAGGKIGSYDDTKPLYVEDSKLRKSGTHKGKTGKSIKTSYYKSYKALRQQQGAESAFVNVRFTNDLQSDFANADLSSTSNALATPKPQLVRADAKEIVYQVSLKRALNIKKKEGLEDKYGEIFAPSEKEKQTFYTVLRKEVKVA